MSRPLPEPWARGSGRAACVLALLTVAAFPGVLQGRVFYERDIQAYWYPQVETFARIVAAGVLPLWDPNEGFGQPLLADPSSQVLYPFTWLNLVLSPDWSYTLLVLSHLWGSGMGFWLLSRRWLASGPALLAAAAWCCSGPLLSTVSMTPHFMGAAWIPWVLLGLERVMERKAVSRVAVLGALAGMQSLTGSADMCSMTALLGGGRLLLHLARSPDRHRTAVALALPIACAGLFAFALTAAQWLPSLELLRSSNRTAGAAFQMQWSLHPLSALDFVVRRLTTDLPINPAARQHLFDGREPFLQTLYLGATTLVAVGLALGFRPRRGRVLAAGFVLLVALALGRHLPLLPALTALPPFSILRYPVKYLVPAAALWAMMIGLGGEAWLAAWTERQRRAACVLAAIVVAAAGAAIVLVRWIRLHPETAMRWLEAPIPAGVAADAFLLDPVVRVVSTAAGLAALAAVLLLWRSLRPVAPVWLTAAAVVVMLGDIGQTGTLSNPLAPSQLARYRPPVVDLVRGSTEASQPTPRVFVARPPIAWLNTNMVRAPAGWSRQWAFALGVQETLAPPTGARWGLRGSYDGDPTGLASPAMGALSAVAYHARATPLGVRLLQLGSVSTIVATTESPLPLPVAATVESVFAVPTRVHEVPDPLPSAYLVSGVRVASSLDEGVATLASGTFDPRLEVLLSPPAAAVRAIDGFRGQAAVLSWRPDAIEIETSASHRAHLVLTEAWDRGWTARVDGAAAPVEAANLLFRAVALPPGRHRVLLRYRPASVTVGCWISAAAIVAGLAIAAGTARRSRGVPSRIP